MKAFYVPALVILALVSAAVPLSAHHSWPVSFERLVQELADDHQLFVMDRKGTSIRGQEFQGNPCFLLTDHIPMPKKTFHSLERLGAKKVTLGSKMLFASQCVVLIHHALDQH